MTHLGGVYILKSHLLAFRAYLVAQMVKNLPAMWETPVRSLGQKIRWSREWKPAPVFWPRESHGQRNLAGYSSWGCKGKDTN